MTKRDTLKPEIVQLILFFRHDEHLSMASVAEKLGVSEGAVDAVLAEFERGEHVDSRLQQSAATLARARAGRRGDIP